MNDERQRTAINKSWMDTKHRPSDIL